MGRLPPLNPFRKLTVLVGDKVGENRFGDAFTPVRANIPTKPGLDAMVRQLRGEMGGSLNVLAP